MDEKAVNGSNGISNDNCDTLGVSASVKDSQNGVAIETGSTDKDTTNIMKNGADGGNANTTVIREGSVTMMLPADSKDSNNGSTVFYNPVQVQNRDLSILMIQLFAERRAHALAVQQYRQEQKVKRAKERSEHSASNTIDLKKLVQDYSDQLTPAEALQSQDIKKDGLVVLDALAASGLRSIRYWKEICKSSGDNAIKHITINDLELAAVERARHNLLYAENGIDPSLILNDNTKRDYGICVQQCDATIELYNSRLSVKDAFDNTPTSLKAPYDVIDLDPYGSAAPFVDGAIQAANCGNNGSCFLCFTCTDSVALCGAHPETCYGRYAAMPIPRVSYLQELALRIFLGTVATAAAKHGRIIKPILSVGVNFYIRVFVEISVNKAAVNDLSLQMGQVYQSTQCPSFHVVPVGQKGGRRGGAYQPGRCEVGRCEETGSAFKVGGPFWLGPLHDSSVLHEAIRRLQSTDLDSKPSLKYLATKDRLLGLLSNCYEELNDVPLYYVLTDLASTLQLTTPPIREVRAALINAGYRVSSYHKEPQAIKTDAPNSVVWDIMRAYYEKNSPKKPPPVDSAAAKILRAKPSIEVDFSIPDSLLKAENAQRKIGAVRFPHNPEKNWGPKKAASGYKRKADEAMLLKNVDK